MSRLFFFPAFLVLAYVSIGAEVVRVFYDVGPITYEISEFHPNGGPPVLDTLWEKQLNRSEFDGNWSYSGELPLDAKFMSTVMTYTVGMEPVVYSNRDKPLADSARSLNPK